MLKLDDFTKHYLIAALWSSVDTDSNPLDDNYTIEDFSEEAVKQAILECKIFQIENRRLLFFAGCAVVYAHPEYTSEMLAGHDFWLTRNRHGVGFWDRQLGEIGEKLTEACRQFKSLEVEVGDDGKLFFG